MLRALDCSAFMPSPPRTFSDSVGFTPALAPLEQFTSVSALSPRAGGQARARLAHHRADSGVAQDLAASQSPFRDASFSIGYTAYLDIRSSYAVGCAVSPYCNIQPAVALN